MTPSADARHRALNKRIAAPRTPDALADVLAAIAPEVHALREIAPEAAAQVREWAVRRTGELRTREADAALALVRRERAA